MLIHENEIGEEEWAVLAGKALWDGEELQIDRDPNHEPFSVPDHALDRLRPVPEEVCDDADPGEYESMGLSWPEIG